MSRGVPNSAVSNATAKATAIVFNGGPPRPGPARRRRLSPALAGRSLRHFATVGSLVDLSRICTVAPGGAARPACSHVEAELDHVAIAHHVFLALDPGLAGGPGRGDRPGRHQVVEGDDLGLDEPALEVGVD